MEIRKLNEAASHFLPHPHQPFVVIGRLIPIYDGKQWSYCESLCNENRQKKYDDEIIEPRAYIDNERQTVFLAVCDELCVGLIRMSTGVFGDGYIEDFMVDSSYRHLGVGKKLMDSAVGWCKERQHNEIRLETQDNNLQACRFYIKYGFSLCGMDTQKYAFTKYRDEIALYFCYML